MAIINGITSSSSYFFMGLLFVVPRRSKQIDRCGYFSINKHIQRVAIVFEQNASRYFGVGAN